MGEPTIGDLIARRRTELGQSDEKAAREIDISQSVFSRWRAGRYIPQEDKIPALARWLDVDETTVERAITVARRSQAMTIEEAVAAVRQLLAEVERLAARAEQRERTIDELERRIAALERPAARRKR